MCQKAFRGAFVYANATTKITPSCKLGCAHDKRLELATGGQKTQNHNKNENEIRKI